MATIDVRTYGILALETFPVSGTLNGNIMTTPVSNPTHILRSFRVLEEIPNKSGEKTVFTTLLPTLATLPNPGEQAIVTHGVYQSMIFENDGAGNIVYRKQASTPMRATLMTISERDAVGAAIGAGNEFWYGLQEPDGAAGAGFYRITPDGFGGGVQLGPFIGSTQPTTVASGILVDGTVIPNLLSTNVRGALAEHQSDIDALVNDVNNLKLMKGILVARQTTLAALNLTPHKAGDWAILTQDDGTNQAGIYVGNGSTFSLVSEIPEAAVATNTVAGLMPAAFVHPLSPNSALPGSAARIGQFFVRTGATSPGVYVATDTLGGWAGPIGASGAGTTNLSVTPSSTSVTVVSSTGTPATINIADNANAGLIGPGYIHPQSPGSLLPGSAARIGQLFVRTGATAPGIYAATDVLGGWAGPLGGAANLGVIPAPTNNQVTSTSGTPATLVLADNTNAGLLGPGYIHPNSPGTTLPGAALRPGQLFVRTGATAPGLYMALDTAGNWSGPLSGGGGALSPIDLTATLTATNATVAAPVGTAATIPLATDTNAGLLAPGLIAGSGAALPTTATRLGQLFWLNGVGLHKALDLVGNWSII
jgi:hypothetical protein